MRENGFISVKTGSVQNLAIQVGCTLICSEKNKKINKQRIWRREWLLADDLLQVYYDSTPWTFTCPISCSLICHVQSKLISHCRIVNHWQVQIFTMAKISWASAMRWHFSHIILFDKTHYATVTEYEEFACDCHKTVSEWKSGLKLYSVSPALQTEDRTLFFRIFW